jgi:hypothetical protein
MQLVQTLEDCGFARASLIEAVSPSDLTARKHLHDRSDAIYGSHSGPGYAGSVHLLALLAILEFQPPWWHVLLLMLPKRLDQRRQQLRLLLFAHFQRFALSLQYIALAIGEHEVAFCP